ncbi:hypothetical protein C8R45DRAFT_1107215 [Mycena sanguinolenta]|nr:hypothetical protein C8R45DRAFT_1107215 [Mycena sanguinolenta]
MASCQLTGCYIGAGQVILLPPARHLLPGTPGPPLAPSLLQAINIVLQDGSYISAPHLGRDTHLHLFHRLPTQNSFKAVPTPAIGLTVPLLAFRFLAGLGLSSHFPGAFRATASTLLGAPAPAHAKYFPCALQFRFSQPGLPMVTQPRIYMHPRPHVDPPRVHLYLRPPSPPCACRASYLLASTLPFSFGATAFARHSAEPDRFAAILIRPRLLLACVPFLRVLTITGASTSASDSPFTPPTRIP